MSHRSRLTGFLLTSAMLIGFAAPASAMETDRVIVLPGATSAEGIAAGSGSTFYAGVLYGGDIYKGSIASGTAKLFIDVPQDRFSAGMSVDVAHNLLFVAGGPGRAWVYSTVTGAEVARYDLADPNNSLVNDVTVTPDGAWFTDSRQARLYFIPIVNGLPGAAGTLVVTGPAADTSARFNLNGIRMSSSGCTLIVSHSGLGKLFTVNVETGASALVAGADVPFADGIELAGQRLYVVQNYWDQISVFRLSPCLSQATLEKVIVHPDYDVPTAAVLIGDRLAAVNSHFDEQGQPRGTRFEVIVTDP